MNKPKITQVLEKELNLKDLKKLSDEIDKNIIKANEDFETELKYLQENRTTLPANTIHKKIIKWKHEYIKSKTSISHLLKNNSTVLFDFDTSNSERIAKLVLIYCSVFHQNSLIKFEQIVKEVPKEVYTFHKYKLFYNASSVLINNINNNDNINFKFPNINNFEVDTFDKIYNNNITLTNEYNQLLAKYKSDLQDLLEQSQKNKLSHNNDIKISDLKSEVSKLEEKNLNLKHKVSDLKIDLKYEKAASEILKKEAVKKDYFSNPQFNNLYWGDNYPALKVLFEFLQVNQIYKYSWSHFASQMSIGDLTVIQFYTGNINKAELGYLFYQIKSFFSLELF